MGERSFKPGKLRLWFDMAAELSVFVREIEKVEFEILWLAVIEAQCGGL